MSSLPLLISIAALYAFGTVLPLEWETTPQPVVYACLGKKVTLPWRFKVTAAEGVRDIRWYFDGAFHSSLVGTETSGYFLATPPYAQRVRHVINGVIELSDLTLSDLGNYSVEVNVERAGSMRLYTHTVLLQVGDGLMAEGNTLTVTQDPEALWDSSTQQWLVRLTCGLFTFMGQPPLNVTWRTPALKTKSSTGYDNGNFYLTLPAPVAGGNYTCHIPEHLLSNVCIQDNQASTASVLVDEVKARLTLLEAEKRTLKSENGELKDQLRETEVTHSKAIANLTQRMNEQLEAVRIEVRSLWNISQERFLLRGPCDSSNHLVLSDGKRAVTYSGETKMCDKNLAPGWYRFVLDGTNAVMPTDCVPRKHCGTNAPYWLNLEGNALPEPGQQTDARACAHWSRSCCQWHTPVSVRNCGAFFVYKLTPYNHCNLAFCAKKVHS